MDRRCQFNQARRGAGGRKIKTLGVMSGQGHGVIARKHMATAMAEGRWVLLQNTHLGFVFLCEVRTGDVVTLLLCYSDSSDAAFASSAIFIRSASLLHAIQRTSAASAEQLHMQQGV